MNKQQFLAALKERMNALPENDSSRWLDYYEEMINDRMEDGMTEEQAVAEMDDLDGIMSQILEDIPLQRLVRARVKKPRSLQGWEIALIVLGSPLWLTLLLAAAAVALALAAALLAVYVTMWAVVVTLYAAVLTLAIACVAGVACGVVMLFLGNPTAALLLSGGGLVCGGLSILMFFAVNLIAKGLIALTRKLFRAVKIRLIRKG